MSLPWKLAPAVPSVGTSTARASIPASRACSRVLPTAATCGSVKVTRGEPMPSATASTSRPSSVLGRDPGLVLAHVGEEGAAVDVADRVEPLAAADPQPVVGLEEAALAGLDPDRLEADAPRCGACARPRPGARPPRPRSPSSSSTTTPPPPARRPARLARRCGRRRRAARAAPRPLPRRRRAPRARAGARPPSTRVTRVPSVDQAWASSQPTGPPPSTIMLSGTCFDGRRLAVVPGLGPSRGRRSAASRRRCRWRRRRPGGRSAGRRRPDPALAVEAALAAEELDPAFFQPGQLAGVVEVVDRPRRGGRGPPAGRARRSPPRRRRAPAAPRPSSVGRAQQRLRGHAGVVGAFAADQVRARRSRPLMPPSASRPAQTSPGGARPRARSRRMSRLAHAGTPSPTPYNSKRSSTGATGFDVVDPCERLQVEVAGGLVKPRHKPIRADHEFALAA